ncbi:MAG: PDZ domain-containing protein, partial [Candidatus Hydrogenedentota bacterium]
RGQLGVVIQPLTQELAESFGVDEGRGILIGQVMEGTAADKADLKQGDIIVEYDGQPVGDLNSFRSRIASTAPGTKMDLLILRNGKEIEKTVTIGTLDEEEMAAAAPGGPRGPAKIEKDIGVTVQNLTDDVAAELGYEDEEGVVVTSVEPGSPAAFAGIEAGNLIQEVNRKKVKNIQQFEEALEKASGKEAVLLLISDGEYSRYAALRLAR